MDGQLALAVCLGALLSMLREEEGGAPSNIVYVAFMTKNVSFNDYVTLLDIAKRSDLIRESNHVLSITERGKQLAAKLDAATAA